MSRLDALISSLIDLVGNLFPESENSIFVPSPSLSAQPSDICAVEADFKRLKRILKRIKATLYDAEERNIRDRSVRLWLKEIREVGYEAECVLDEYMYDVYRVQIEARNASELNSIKGGPDMSGVCSVQISNSMVDRIRDIKNRFEEIVKDREALYLREEDAPRRKKRRYTPTGHLVVEQNVFGREEEKEKVINSLFLDNHQKEVISVMPIVGKGGIGKTTLAQLVYNDKRVQESFDLKGWVCVSIDFSIERITRDIIESLTKKAPVLNNPSVLMEELANGVRGKRVFLVLDDVWNEELCLWESLKMPLIRAKKATILVTTRNISISRIMQTMDPLLLSYLSDDRCWSLFTHYAFQGIDHANQATLVEIGKEIVKKCSGLPLAVKSIASLLSHEEDLQNWVEVLESDMWELDAGNEILAPLQISYEHLPTCLKPCLLLCSMFPKGYEYSMNLMSRLWIAHGYIEWKEGKPIEQMAANYTKMLYERSFFDDYNIKRDKYGLSIDVTFRLHDMVHDLAWLNSEKTCCSAEQGKESFFPREVRHLYLNEELRELPEIVCSIDIAFMQTLIMRYSGPRPIHTKGEDTNMITSNCLSKAEHLRALDLEYREDHALPFSLGNLKNLRYLSLGNHEFITQFPPESIFSCYNLRILILDLCCYHMELEGIGNLINLQFLQLYLSSSFCCELPESLGLLKKLRVLEIHGNKGYNNGGYSKIHYNRENFSLPECIGNLVELHRIFIFALPLQKLPNSLCKLTNLKELILQNCLLKELPEDFGNLTSLQHLFLEELNNFPPSCTKLIHSCTMNVCNLMMQPENCHGAVGWLKDFNDIKGTLVIKDICNIRSIEDAKNANLICKFNLEQLSLLWDENDYLDSASSELIYATIFGALKGSVEWKMPRDYSAKKGILKISLKKFKKCKFLNRQDLNILENFQPHPSLKHLEIGSYHGLWFPRWIGDPLSCASLVKFWIRSCPHITSLPLGKMLSLKHLHIADCSKLLHLKRESLPSQLKHLIIHRCNSLVEIALLESLTELKISICIMLKSLSTVHLELSEKTSELCEFAGNYCHFKPSEELMRSFPSLKKLTIEQCPNFVIGLHQLVLAVDCDVDISDCTNLKNWCLHHNFNYSSAEGFNGMSSSQIWLEQYEMMAFKQEMRETTLAVWNSAQNTVFTSNSSLVNLAALYQPPITLMYEGSFEKVKMDAALKEKWLLVNIQSTEEFNSHMLNRDTWQNETLCQIIRSNFLFWQVYNTMSEGQMVCTFYNLITLPAILVINPITGQKMRAWTGMVQPDRLLEDLLPYLDKGPKYDQTV